MLKQILIDHSAALRFNVEMSSETDSQSLEERLSKVEDALSKIVERNNRVELNKGWETSLCRFLLIVITTYFVMCLVFKGMGSDAS